MAEGVGGSPTSAYDHLMKILIIGDSGSNKRRLLGKYLQDEELTDTTTLGMTSVQPSGHI